MTNGHLPFGESAYLAAGAVNAVFMALCFVGAWLQLQTVRRRRMRPVPGESATDILSTQQNVASFIGASTFFVYGYSLQSIDHFIVWPRLAAAGLYLAILWEIRRDRPSRSMNATVACLVLILGFEIAGLLCRDHLGGLLDWLAVQLMLGVALLLAVGYGLQIALILNSRRTGAVSLRMMQFILAMDVSTLVLALCIGIRTAWAHALVALVSATTKTAVLLLHWWVRACPRPHPAMLTRLSRNRS